MSVIIKGMKKPNNCHECPLLYATNICDGFKPCPIIPIKHGRWIGKPIAGYSTVRCSLCDNVLIENDGKFPYCPYCGYPMDGAKEEEEEKEKKNIFELLQDKGQEITDVFLKKRF